EEQRLEILGQIRGWLEPLKMLAKYAVAEVAAVFEGIKDKTIVHYQLLYSGPRDGLGLARLVLGTGRDKTVEARLSGGSFEVPSQHFANAGQQRAFALAFFFALLDRHPGGLGFVLMDDPILSLDDDHRESWSGNILRPKLEALQIILATHQRQFLNNCRYDFQA